jgi:hypothetical protein
MGASSATCGVNARPVELGRSDHEIEDSLNLASGVTASGSCRKSVGIFRWHSTVFHVGQPINAAAFASTASVTASLLMILFVSTVRVCLLDRKQVPFVERWSVQFTLIVSHLKKWIVLMYDFHVPHHLKTVL